MILCFLAFGPVGDSRQEFTYCGCRIQPLQQYSTVLNRLKENTLQEYRAVSARASVSRLWYMKQFQNDSGGLAQINSKCFMFFFKLKFGNMSLYNISLIHDDFEFDATLNMCKKN